MRRIAQVDQSASPVIVTVPLRTVPGLNAREHWAARAKRVKRERTVVWVGCCAALRSFTDREYPPYFVHLVRISPRGKIDSDNLQGALKAVRDQVAYELCVDDGDEMLVRWTYAAERGPWGVRIEVRREP
jgi:hypothetical protein